VQERSTQRPFLSHFPDLKKLCHPEAPPKGRPKDRSVDPTHDQSIARTPKAARYIPHCTIV
jgi:hypothetical protein